MKKYFIKAWDMFIAIAVIFTGSPAIEDGSNAIKKRIEKEGIKMITQRMFAVAVAVFIGLVGVCVWHAVDHPTPETSIEPLADTHTHHYYWDGTKDNPNQLIKRHNETYGVPKAGVKHRHTGADYIQGGIVTWKHVDDQHVKLQK